MISCFASSARRHRLRLLCATAAICAPGLAVAQTTDKGARVDIANAEIAAQGSADDASKYRLTNLSGLASDPTIGLSPQIRSVVPVSQIVVSSPSTPTTAIDPTNITGVGQMIVDEKNGFIGLCTGTLINPRTVIFAAHCVNERAANAYGENSGGQPIAFGFAGNNNVAGNSAFGGYLSGPTKYQTVTSRYLYDVNYVAYNPLSLEPAANSFLYGDVAIASLDTPTTGIPTWSLLFSPLPTPGSIGASGTGYHVVIDGYGNNGTGITGSTGGIDYRRRVADNMLGGLASLKDFEQFLFGPSGSTLPQNLYWIDFDDPRRGTASASPYDFNAWRDNATSKEGITASGDSGGPLILDATYAKQLVIGVLSGGYTRFFNGQPANGYGTASFYQPLYLYWDWIAANNPYHYVSAKAGDANWNDPTHWQTTLDPNYYVISGTSAVNGIPTTPGQQNTPQPGFGQTCFQSGGISDCFDIATRTETIAAKPIGTDGTSDTPGLAATDKATVGIGTLGTGTADTQASGTGGADTAAGNTAAIATTLPGPTLANGLPGATNFVPTNFDGNRLLLQAPRYFDVTLSAAGTTTLDTAVTIDRLTIAGLNAGLNITATGSLTSNIDVTQQIGTVTVNGALISRGDYFLAVGGLSGNGTITAPFFTSMAGTIAPGAPGTIGTLTFVGNAILANANTYLLDIGASGQSDRISVLTGAAGSGIANVGGTLAISGSAATLRANNLYTILTAQGGVTGSFVTPGALSAILRPTLVYSANQVQLRIDAASYGSVVAPSSRLQLAYAQLLDSNRVQAGKYDAIYGPLDLQSAATIQATLNGLAPAAETTLRSTSNVQLEAASRFITGRLGKLDPNREMGGTVAMIGQPIQLASLSLQGMPIAPAAGADGAERTVSTGKLPDDMRGYLAGGYINGHALPSSTAVFGGRDTFDGWFVTGGLEKNVGGNAAVGVAVSYSEITGNAGTPGQTASSRLLQGSVYGKIDLYKGLMLDGQASGGALFANTRRAVTFLGNPYLLRSGDTPLTLNADIGLSKALPLGGSFTLTPRTAIRAAYVSFDNVAETGGPMALTYDRKTIKNLQTRDGLTLQGNLGGIQPTLTATYVHEFANHQTIVGANFVGGAGPDAFFGLNSTDHDWLEVGGGLTIKGSKVDISVEADTTALRKDASYQTYRGTLTVHF